MPLLRYATEVELELAVEVVSAFAGRPAHGWNPPEPAEIELTVRLGAVDVTGALPADVLESLEADAFERLREAAEP